ATYHTFKNVDEYVEMLGFCFTTPLLQKIIKMNAWEEYLTRYARLLTCPPVKAGKTVEILEKLFGPYRDTLSALDDKTVARRGREILNEVMIKGMSVKK
ncbi:MAG: hypothetical protein JSR46_03335, partial [Verrucomicrobia bacterium]|nr:hypothetical protein [Verrucomicrobiota bacterium]